MANTTKIPICITVDTEILTNFKAYCKQNGMKLSTKINNMMADAVKATKLPIK